MRVVLLIACAYLVACGTKTEAPPVKEPDVKEPDHIEVDHILIGIKMPRLPGVERTPVEAEKLAQELMAQFESGDGDWASLKRRYSADPPPGGPYKMCNTGVAPTEPGEVPRGQMVPAFGDVGFTLEVGEIGLAKYDPRTSPYGFHIIKRTK